MYIDDIALVQLAENFTWTKTVRPICLPDHHEENPNVKDPLDNKMVTVAGWGYTAEKSQSKTIFCQLYYILALMKYINRCQVLLSFISQLMIILDYTFEIS